MRTEIIAIGNELLNGDLADTNTQLLSRTLRDVGLAVSEARQIPDVPEVLIEAFRVATGRSDLVLVTGGLGPTEDDLTIASAAQFMEKPLIGDEAYLERLKQRFIDRGYPFTPNNAKQVLHPEGSHLLANPVGTAPGVRLEVNGTTFFFFPGVPFELKHLVRLHLLPWLESAGVAQSYTSKTFKTFGRTESKVAEMLEGFQTDPRIHLAYRARFPEIQVTVHVQESESSVAEALLQDRSAWVRSRLGSVIYSEDAKDDIASVVLRLLADKGATVALAESCTGGLASSMLTGIPGSSAVLHESYITYANAAKTKLVGVPEELLEAHGAVSAEVACAMAEGARVASGSTIGVGITGIAGPGGGTESKPVGLVHLAVADADGVVHRERRWPFGRNKNRTISAWAAWDMVRRRLLGI